jgi:hypothetical protein
LKSAGEDGKAVTLLLQSPPFRKPEPVMKTAVPGPPIVGLIVKVDVTVNDVDATSFPGEPVAVTE